MSRQIRQLFLPILVVYLLAFPGVASFAQEPQYPYAVDTKPSRGIMPNSEQLSGPLDSIDPISGKLHIQVPLAALPLGNAGSGFDLSLVYDSNLFDLVAGEVGDGRISQSISSTLTGGGWRYNFANFRVEGETRYIPTWEQAYCLGDPLYVVEHERIYRYRISLPDGSQHLLHLLGHGDEKRDGYYGDGFYAISMDGVRSNCARESGRYPINVNGVLTYFTTDGSYLRFQINANGSSWFNQQWTLFYPDGRRVVGRGDQAEHIYDANGNGIHIAKQLEDGRTVTYITDDFGRSLRLEHGFASSATEREDKITVPGPEGLLEWRVKWEKIQVGGTGFTYICYQDNFLFPMFTTHCPVNFQYWVVKYIQLPLAAPGFDPPPAAPWTNFEFTYSPTGQGYGRLLTMRAPGGTQYAYCCDAYSASLFAQDLAYAGYRRRTLTHDGVSDVWSYETINTTSKRVVAPDGGETIYHFYDPQVATLYWARNLIYRIEQPGGTVRKRQWTRNKVFSLAAPVNVDANNPYVERESVTIDKVVGQPRTVVTDTLIDKNGNPLRVKQYNWSNTLDGDVMESPGALERITDKTYYAAVPDSTNTADGLNRYWSPSASPRLNAVARETVLDGASAVKSIIEFEYDAPLFNGNVTRQRQWDDARPGCTPSTPLSGNCPSRNRRYDVTGNLTDVFAPEIQTHISYSGPYPSLVEYAAGTPSARSFTYEWNTAVGLLRKQTDDQSGLSTTFGYDAYGRQRVVDVAGMRTAETFFDDENRTVLIKEDLRAFRDGLLQTSTRRDQLGRVDLVRTSDGTPLSPLGDDGIKSRTLYRTFEGGTAVIASTPYRSTSDPTLEWTCTHKDQSGRVVFSAIFNGPASPADCQTSANRSALTVTDYHSGSGTPRTRITDPAGRSVDRYADALGRLVAVVEDPLGLAYVTAYQYDTLDNLISATQIEGNVTQLREFAYTSLGRLKTTFNPESGTIEYTYRDSGDLLTRQDTRGHTTTFSYDDLHRVVEKTFSNDGDSTPDAFYEYHLAGPCVGKLKSVTSETSSMSYNTCDDLGRVLSHTQFIVGGGFFDFAYTYWLNGALKTMKYPSGRMVNFDVDDAARGARVYTDEKVYADLTASTTPYTADGRIAQFKLGNKLWETREHRTPGIPTVLKLGTTESAGDKLELQYNYAAAANNGNLISHVVRRGSTSWAQTYEYDDLNRLVCATEAVAAAPLTSCSSGNSWRQTFGYDRFGNRWVSSSTGFSLEDVHELVAETTIDKARNRLFGSTYDEAGNQTLFTPWSLSYDAENRLIAATSPNNGSSWFTYDGDGRRIKKVVATPDLQTTFYVYDASGRLAAEYSTLPPQAETTYLFADILGTPRAITNQDGFVVDCADYSPFGRLLETSTRSLPCHRPPSHAFQQFTGHVRDQETKLDYLGARYFSGAEGRFLSADWSAAPSPVPYGDFSDPQTLNLYAYVRNNPLTRRDADGHCCREHWEFFKEEMAGLWETTGGSVVEIFTQVTSGQVIDNVRDTYLSGNVPAKLATAGSEFVSQTSQMVKGTLQGDPRSIGRLA
ncbi:MAG TPA: RHS repeat-associated core domain-containing protein, partial [Terriglobia bacterium]|nr:RHS repeat-associated core domain-containing protein [Terriglobia bacterium]